MAKNIILCVLSSIGKNQNLTPISYKAPDGQIYEGCFANEAPTKYLIAEATQSGSPISDIFYLDSIECDKPITQLDSMTRTYEYFDEQIQMYCEANGFDTPAREPIMYDATNPAESLEELSSALSEDVGRLSIDITGGPRNASMMLTMACNAIRTKFPHSELGPIVYGNFVKPPNSSFIQTQNNTYKITYLIEAASAFSDYGKGDKLFHLFEEDPGTHTSSRDLCKSIYNFSNDLSLCRVVDIADSVKEIQNAFKVAIEDLTAMAERHGAARDALFLLREGLDDHERIEYPLDDLLQQIHIDNQEGSEDRIAEAERIFQESYMTENEQVLLALLPNMQQQFVPVPTNEGDLTLDIIQWCTDRNLLQQALCIYREKISGVLFQRGYFKMINYCDDLENMIPDICNCCKLDFPSFSIKLNGEYKRRRSPNDPPIQYSDYFELVDPKVTELKTILAWYYVLRKIRNDVMHLGNSEVDWVAEKCTERIKSLYGIEVSLRPSNEEVKSYLLEAIDSVRHPVNEVERLRKYLSDYLEISGEKMVLFDDFSNWCSRQKYQITKAKLGLPKNPHVCAGIDGSLNFQEDDRFDGFIVEQSSGREWFIGLE